MKPVPISLASRGPLPFQLLGSWLLWQQQGPGIIVCMPGPFLCTGAKNPRKEHSAMRKTLVLAVSVAVIVFLLVLSIAYVLG